MGHQSFLTYIKRGHQPILSAGNYLAADVVVILCWMWVRVSVRRSASARRAARRRPVGRSPQTTSKPSSAAMSSMQCDGLVSGGIPDPGLQAAAALARGSHAGGNRRQIVVVIDDGVGDVDVHGERAGGGGRRAEVNAGKFLFNLQLEIVGDKGDLLGREFVFRAGIAHHAGLDLGVVLPVGAGREAHDEVAGIVQDAPVGGVRQSALLGVVERAPNRRDVMVGMFGGSGGGRGSAIHVGVGARRLGSGGLSRGDGLPMTRRVAALRQAVLRRTSRRTERVAALLQAGLQKAWR